MKSDRVLIFAVLFLAAGVGVLCAYVNGTTGLSFGYPFSANKLSIDITDVGVPLLVGLPLIGIGLLLMAIAFIAAIVSQFRPAESRRAVDMPAKRRGPFEDVSDPSHEG